MAKITWKGEAEGPPSCTWNNITFTVGRAVEVTDETMIRKARGNPFFKVEEGNGPTQWREPATEADPADEPPGVSFFDDPPEPLDMPPDYPPEDEPKRKPGRPRKVKDNGL